MILVAKQLTRDEIKKIYEIIGAEFPDFGLTGRNLQEITITIGEMGEVNLQEVSKIVERG